MYLVGYIRKDDKNYCVDAYCINMRIVRLLTVVSIGDFFFGKYQNWKKKKVLQILVQKLKLLQKCILLSRILKGIQQK